MDDNISSIDIPSANTMDDINGDDDDSYTTEDLAVVLGMYVRQLLLGPNTIYIRNKLHLIFREMEPTSFDFKGVHGICQQLGMDRDEQEIKRVFSHQGSRLACVYRD
jgi:hypothetical protein